MSSKNSGRWWPLKATRQRIKKGLPNDRDRWIYIRKSYTKEANPRFYQGEYDKLCADSRVVTLAVSENNGIRLTTAPVIKVLFVNGQRYTVYLGTYEIQVKIMSYSLYFGTFAISPATDFRVECLHSGRYDGRLQTTYPVNEAHNFCFGVRTNFIEELANTGEFYAFFTVVLDSLWHINQKDKESIIRDFRKVDENRNYEPYRIPHASLQNPFERL